MDWVLSPLGFTLGIAGALFVGAYAVIAAWTRPPRPKKRPHLYAALRACRAREQKPAASGRSRRAMAGRQPFSLLKKSQK